MPQKPENNTRYKIGYYLHLPGYEGTLPDVFRQAIIHSLLRSGINVVTSGTSQRPGSAAQLIISTHPDHPGRFSINVIPGRANKAEAIRFVQQKLRLEHGQVFFTGNAGNDIEALQAFNSALVGNHTLDAGRRMIDWHEATPGSTSQNVKGGARVLKTGEKHELFIGGPRQTLIRGVLAGLRHRGILPPRLGRVSRH
jgi:hypothetical protein